MAVETTQLLLPNQTLDRPPVADDGRMADGLPVGVTEPASTLDDILSKANPEPWKPEVVEQVPIGVNLSELGDRVASRGSRAIPVGAMAVALMGVALTPNTVSEKLQTVPQAEASVHFVNTSDEHKAKTGTILDSNVGLSEEQAPRRIAVERWSDVSMYPDPENYVVRRFSVLHYDPSYVQQKKDAGKPYEGDFYQRVMVNKEMTSGEYMARAVVACLQDGEPEAGVVVDELRGASKDQMKDFVTEMRRLMAENQEIKPDQISISIGTGENVDWNKMYSDILMASLEAGFTIEPQVYVSGDRYFWGSLQSTKRRDISVADMFLGKGGFGTSKRDRLKWLMRAHETLNSESKVSVIVGITGDYMNTKYPAQLAERVGKIFYDIVLPRVGNAEQQKMIREQGISTWKADARTYTPVLKSLLELDQNYRDGNKKIKVKKIVPSPKQKRAIDEADEQLEAGAKRLRKKQVKNRYARGYKHMTKRNKRKLDLQQRDYMRKWQKRTGDYLLRREMLRLGMGPSRKR